jgi:uncharacterized membrane protein
METAQNNTPIIKHGIGLVATYFVIYIGFMIIYKVLPSMAGIFGTIHMVVNIAYSLLWLFVIYKFVKKEDIQIPVLTGLYDKIPVGNKAPATTTEEAPAMDANAAPMETPTETPSMDNTPAEETPAMETPTPAETPTMDAPVEATVPTETTAPEAPTTEMSAAEPAVETPVMETPAETPTMETPVEAPAQSLAQEDQNMPTHEIKIEPATEEAPVAETPAPTETPVMETPAEAPTETPATPEVAPSIPTPQSTEETPN